MKTVEEISKEILRLKFEQPYEFDQIRKLQIMLENTEKKIKFNRKITIVELNEPK